MYNHTWLSLSADPGLYVFLPFPQGYGTSCLSSDILVSECSFALICCVSLDKLVTLSGFSPFTCAVRILRPCEDKWGCGWLMQCLTLCLSSKLPFLRSQRKWPSIPLPDAAFTLSLLIRMEYLLNARLGWAFGGEKQASGQACSVDDPAPSSSPSFQFPGLDGVRSLLAGHGLPCAVLRGRLTNRGGS